MNNEQFNKILDLFNKSEEDKKNIINLQDFINKNIDFNDIPNSSKKLKKFLKDLKNDKYNPKYFIFFHATGISNMNNINNKGLLKTSLKTKKSLQSGIGYVYLSLNYNSAKTFGELAYPNEKIIVYSVLIPVKDIKPDKDQIFNQNLYGNQNLKFNLENSLLFGNGICVKRNIDNYDIRICNNIFEENFTLENNNDLILS